MNIMKLIILLGFLVIFSGAVASAQTAMGAGNVAASVGAPGQRGVFDAAGVFPGSGGTSPQPNNATIAKTGAANMNLNSDNSFQGDMQHPMGFVPAPGGPAQPATGQLANSSPGTNSIGTFGSGQSVSTNPANPITESPSGGTTIIQGQTGETNAITPGTSGTGQTGGSVPGTISANTVLATPIPGTESIGTFGSGQTTVTNPGNTFTVAPPGGTTITQGQTGETNAITPGTSGTGQTGGTTPGTITGNTVLANSYPRNGIHWNVRERTDRCYQSRKHIHRSPPGSTTISLGQSGETDAVTPGTPGTGQTGGSVPGTITGNSALGTPIPGTESIGTFGGGQTVVTNPGNTFSARPPGGTTIALGPTGETNAITPGTSGTGQTGNTVPGVSFTGSSAIIATVGSAIPGTQSIGSFGSGQTIVTNPGNPFSVGPPGTTTVGVGPTGQANAFTPGISGSSIPSSGLTFGSTTPTVSGSTFGAAVAGGFGGGVTAGSFGPGGRR